MLKHRLGSPQNASRLTAAQEQIWLLHHLLSARQVLNMSYALAIEGPLEVPTLRRALQEMVQRHEPLRTVYPAAGGRPVAEVHKEGGLVLREVDLRHLEAEDAAAETARLAALEAREPFDLGSGPVLRSLLLALGPARHVLLLNFHHLCADGWSLDVFSRETSAMYSAFLHGGSPGLDIPPACTGHAEWQGRWLKSEEASVQLGWWTRTLAGTLPLSFRLPQDKSNRETEPLAMSRRVLGLPPSLLKEVELTGRRRGASPFMVFLAALKVLLARWTGIFDVIVGTLVANRPTPEAAVILGAHYNPLLLRTSLSGDPCLGEVLMRVVESALPALERQDLPFTVISRALSQELGGFPVTPAVVLQIDRYPLHAFSLEGTRVTELHLDESGARSIAELASPRTLLAATNAPLTFFLREGGGSYTLSLFYRTALLDNGTAAWLMRSYVEVLAAMVDRLDASIGELALAEDEISEGNELSSERPAPVPRLLPITAGGPVAALSPVTALVPNER